jgi:hypothetical protein
MSNPITNFYVNMTPERRLTFETYLTIALLLLILLQFWLLTWMPGEAARLMREVNQAKADLHQCQELPTAQFINITDITK